MVASASFWRGYAFCAFNSTNKKVNETIEQKAGRFQFVTKKSAEQAVNAEHG
jgi:hypothetical protein